MLEIGAVIALANSSYRMLKQGIEVGRELQDMTGTLASFFDCSEKIQEAAIQNEETPYTKKLLSGKSVEAEALEITAAKHKMAALEKELREYLIYSGQGEFYKDMMKERRRIKLKRLEAARAAADRRRTLIDFVCLGVLATLILLIISMLFSLIL